MAVVPVIFTGVFYPKGKTADDKPLVGTFIGNAAIAGLHPDNTPPEGGGDGPVHIWGPTDPRPSNPIWWEGFPNNPPPNVRPPDEFPGQPAGVKPFPPDGGWGYSERTGWVYKPGPGQAQPKK